MTHPPRVRLCPNIPGNPRIRIEGESPQAQQGHRVFVAARLAMTGGAGDSSLRKTALAAGPTNCCIAEQARGSEANEQRYGGRFAASGSPFHMVVYMYR